VKGKRWVGRWLREEKGQVAARLRLRHGVGGQMVVRRKEAATMAFGRVAAVPWLGPKEGDEIEREWAEWGNEAQFGSGLARWAGAEMEGWGGRGWTGRREKGWWAEMRKEIGIKYLNFWLLI
jgi:hypothetical protein